MDILNTEGTDNMVLVDYADFEARILADLTPEEKEMVFKKHTTNKNPFDFASDYGVIMIGGSK